MNKPSIATVLLIVAVLFATLGLMFNYIHQQRTWDEKESRSAVETSKGFSVRIGKTEMHLRHDSEKADEPPVKSANMNYRWIGGLCGIVAVVMGAIYAMMFNRIRFGVIPIALGLISIAWEYVMYAVGVAVLLLVLSALSS